MNNTVKNTIHRTSAATATVAALLSPVPLADELVFLGVYADLARRIGRAHGRSWRGLPWRPIGWTTVNGLTARAAVNLAVAFVPGVAAVANATTAVILTEWLGEYMDDACTTPERARVYGVKEITALLRRRVARTPDAPATAAAN